jgi:hypothetical protein
MLPPVAYPFYATGIVRKTDWTQKHVEYWRWIMAQTYGMRFVSFRRLLGDLPPSLLMPSLNEGIEHNIMGLRASQVVDYTVFLLQNYVDICNIVEGRASSTGLNGTCVSQASRSVGKGGNPTFGLPLVERRKIQLELLVHCIKHRMAVICSSQWTSDDGILDQDIYRVPLQVHNPTLDAQEFKGSGVGESTRRPWKKFDPNAAPDAASNADSGASANGVYFDYMPSKTLIHFCSNFLFVLESTVTRSIMGVALHNHEHVKVFSYEALLRREFEDAEAIATAAATAGGQQQEGAAAKTGGKESSSSSFKEVLRQRQERKTQFVQHHASRQQKSGGGGGGSEPRQSDEQRLSGALREGMDASIETCFL